LTGSYQLKNVKTVLSAVDQLKNQGYVITDLHLRDALKQVKNSTGLMGRWEILNTQPLTICDTGHNEHGMMEVIKNINNQSYNRLHMVIGMVKDKDITKVLSLLPKKAIYYFCQPAIERAKEVQDLAREAGVFGLFGEAYESVNAAYQSAKKAAQNDDMIFIGGSTFVVAEII
jgi:dihydrofolate synthase/folylpolyglutamate synthase